VQAAVWQLTAGGRSAAHDLCISAPTGSGKTLAYALPIVAALQGYAALPHAQITAQRTCKVASSHVALMRDACHRMGRPASI